MRLALGGRVAKLNAKDHRQAPMVLADLPLEFKSDAPKD